MTLNRYQDFIFVLFLFILATLLFFMKMHWSNISLGIFGFVWEYARVHKKLKARSKEYKYRFSFIKVFYLFNALLNKIPFLVYLGSTLFIIPFYFLVKADVFIAAPLCGTLLAVLINFLMRKYEVH